MGGTVACPGCGAQVAPTGICRYCGATAFVDGVPGKLLPSDLHCPRCPGSPPLRGVEHEGFRADFCPACRGAWFGLGVLEEVVRTSVRQPPSEGEVGLAGPAHGGVEPVRYANCPVCGGGMARVPFARKPLVIIDRCPSHGHWCDGGELAQLKAVARARGPEAALGAEESPPPTEGNAARVAAGLEGDPLMEELRRRPGNWGLVPPEVAAADALDEEFGPRRGWTFGRRRRGGRLDLLSILGFLLDP